MRRQNWSQGERIARNSCCVCVGRVWSISLGAGRGEGLQPPRGEVAAGGRPSRREGLQLGPAAREGLQLERACSYCSMPAGTPYSRQPRVVAIHGK
jgi:hypothetical protein